MNKPGNIVKRVLAKLTNAKPNNSLHDFWETDAFKGHSDIKSFSTSHHQSCILILICMMTRWVLLAKPVNQNRSIALDFSRTWGDIGRRIILFALMNEFRHTIMKWK